MEGMLQVKKYARVGVIGRWKPLHKGGAVLLESLCENASQVVIGVGSANKYNARNPFTPLESEEMITRTLSPRFNNYKIIQVPDFAHVPEYRDGQKWRQYVVDHFGKLDAFASGNEYVADLLKEDYKIINAWELIPEMKRIPLKAAMVRLEMARGGAWKDMVPEQVAEYLDEAGLVQRFRKEFGLVTLAGMIDKDYFVTESEQDEKNHTYEA